MKLAQSTYLLRCCALRGRLQNEATGPQKKHPQHSGKRRARSIKHPKNMIAGQGGRYVGATLTKTGIGGLKRESLGPDARCQMPMIYLTSSFP
jgi:hypothetical protein